MNQRRLPLTRASAVAAVMLMSASCSSGEPCEKTPPQASSCADLTVGGRSYNEWRPFRGPAVLQELDDGNYPECNTAARCGSDGDGLDGFEATDVWRLEGVDPARALVGLRQNSHTRVIFVNVGVDPHTLHPAVRTPAG